MDFCSRWGSFLPIAGRRGRTRHFLHPVWQPLHRPWAMARNILAGVLSISIILMVGGRTVEAVSTRFITPAGIFLQTKQSKQAKEDMGPSTQFKAYTAWEEKI